MSTARTVTVDIQCASRPIGKMATATFGVFPIYMLYVNYYY